jgi:hypothetical protein
MIFHSRSHKGAIAAYVMFACVAALLSVNLTSPTSAALGADWQCSRFALVFTTCTPVRAHETVSTGQLLELAERIGSPTQIRKGALAECVR